MTNIVAQLTITLDTNGRISVTGPIEQTMMCYGLLGVAKDVIRRQGEESVRKVQAPQLAEVAAFGSRHGG